MPLLVYTLVVVFASLSSVISKSVPSVIHSKQKLGNCDHKYPTVDETPHSILLQNDSRRLWKRASEHQLRIEIFYDKSVETLDPAKRDVITKVVPEAVSFWENALKIRGHHGPIKINRKCDSNQYFISEDDPHQYCKEACVSTKCGEVLVPEDHLEGCRTCNADGLDCKQVTSSGPGVKDVDFILYVSAVATPQCGEQISDEAGTVAYAAHCQQEATLDRPIAGHTNICPQAIANSSKEISALSSTIKHELLHALVFSSSLFAFYRDAEGKPRTPRNPDGKPPINRALQVRQWSDSTIIKVTRPYKVRSGVVDRSFHLMVTPRVVEEVRAHFNCSTLEGAELEDQGGDGTAITHWEKRIFQNEAMTGTVHTQNPTYSRLTMALLEDSGWYIPNYDMADELKWGRGLGCDFATLSCMEIMERDIKPRPFCNTLMGGDARTTCTFDRASVGNCNLVVYDGKLPEIYQNFREVEGVSRKDVGKVGGSVTLADFCPYVQEFTWASENAKTRGSHCDDDSNSPPSENNFALEHYGLNSMCFEQSAPWKQKSCTMMKQYRRFGSGCYQFKCSSGRVEFLFRGNTTYVCASEGQVIDVSLRNGDWLHEGSVICPPCEDICGKEFCEGSLKSFEDIERINKKQNEDISQDCHQEGDNSILKSFLESFKFNIQ